MLYCKELLSFLGSEELAMFSQNRLTSELQPCYLHWNKTLETIDLYCLDMKCVI